MASIVDGVGPSTLQFVVDALRTMNEGSLDLSIEANRRKISTLDDRHKRGRSAIRNPDGTGMTVAQIATAANLTQAQVIDIMGRI